MISVIVVINNDYNEFLEECISSILIQNYTNFEIICVVNSSDETSLSILKNLEKVDERINIIVNNVLGDTYIMKNIGLKYAKGDFVLFLEPDVKLYDHSLDVLSEFCTTNSFDMLLYSDDWYNIEDFDKDYSFNHVKSHCEINIKNLFKLLNVDFWVFYNKKFLDKYNLKFLDDNYFEGNNLFFLGAFFSSHSIIFSQNNFTQFISSPISSIKPLDLNLNLFIHVIKIIEDNNDIYKYYKNDFWKYIFGSIFNYIYELRDESQKRIYFKESKLLFDECCFEKGFYNDIHNSLDIMVLEFFNQTIEDVCYTPIKRDISRRLVNENFGPLTIAIKSPHPIGEHTWGDYFFAIALKKSFEKRGFKVVIHELQNWDCEDDNEDIVMVLRGLSKYNPKPEHINIMWNISHPDVITLEEYNSYDAVFISSNKYSKEMDKKLDTIIKPLLQCTDPDVFYPKFNSEYSEDILFVGKTRKVFREIIKDISETSHDFSVYGEGWEEYIDKKYIKGDFIPNEILNQYYSSCKILLNDHWADMRDMDFPSNRLFDALACGALVISDEIASANDVFENNIITYKDSKDLDKKINFYLNNEKERNKKRNAGREIVLSKHTFDNRVDEIIETLKNITF